MPHAVDVADVGRSVGNSTLVGGLWANRVRFVVGGSALLAVGCADSRGEEACTPAALCLGDGGAGTAAQGETGAEGDDDADPSPPGRAPSSTTGSEPPLDEESTGEEPAPVEPKFDVAAMPDISGAGPEIEAVVFAHTSSVLYRLDPDTLAVEQIGPFTGCGSVVDIAVDQDNNIYASAGGIYSVDAETAVCTLVVSGGFGNNLSFVAPGVLDPDREILVSYSGTQYRSIDPESGEITNHGTIPWGVSGDVVSVKDGPTYVSVNGASGVDHLIEVDAETGELIFDAGPIGSETTVYGLGYWGGTIYGFSANGHITEITEHDDGTITAEVIDDGGIAFWGAGSSTSAPVTPEG